MSALISKFALKEESATAALARRVSDILQAGDCILLEGPIGAGKTTFARAIIRDLVGQNEDVPSPTFTLVQVYNVGQTEIWHCDLYRLTHPDEVIELGLEAAFDDAICLIEWPDRLGDISPKSALTAQMDVIGDEHVLTFHGDDNWARRLKQLDE